MMRALRLAIILSLLFAGYATVTARAGAGLACTWDRVHVMCIDNFCEKQPGKCIYVGNDECLCQLGE